MGGEGGGGARLNEKETLKPLLANIYFFFIEQYRKGSNVTD